MHPRPADPTMLAYCAAIVVARDEADSRALISLGEKLGFGTVRDFSHFANDWHAHPLMFFLVHYGIGREAKRQLLDRLRRANSVNICFAPVVLFLQNAQADEARTFMEMGFDDVICLPEDSLVLSTRLATQFGREHTYIETRSYIGPDRAEASGHIAGRNHATLTLLRTPEDGVQILRRQIVSRTR